MAKRLSVLDAKMLALSPYDHWDGRAACNHTLILGTSGSGKSSTSYKQITLGALKLGAGAIFCTAKPEDADAIRIYSALARRLESLIDLDGLHNIINPLAYELARTGNINDVIDVLMAMFEIVRSSGSNPGKSGEQFWTDSPQQMMRATVPIVYAATGTVRIEDILLFIRSAPTSLKQLRDPKWQARSPFWQMILAAGERLAQGPISGFDVATGNRAMAYWEEFAELDPKTSGNIRISITTLLSRFETGLLKTALCGETKVFPGELMMSGGAILLLNFPVQTHGADGAICQKIIKFLAQRAILTRNAMPQHMRERLVMFGADECQNFLYRDAEFLAQCRSSNTMVVFATQSLPTFYAKIGGDHPHDATHHLVSNFNNVILHSSACGETNEWFAKKLGRRAHRRYSGSQGQGGGDNFGLNMGEGTNWGNNTSFGTSWSSGSGSSGSRGGNSSSGTSQGGSDNWGRSRGTNSSWNSSQSWSEQMDWVIEPGFFAHGLLTGGPANRRRVTAIWMRAGHTFAATGSNFLMVEYQQ